MKKKRLIVIGILIAVVIGFTGYNYVFNSEHRDIATEEATVVLSADELYKEFQTNEVEATANYLDEVLELQGKITTVDGSDIVLSNGVQVSFSVEGNLSHEEGNQLTIKGRCVGYDELLELVKIDQSVIIKK